MVATIVVTSVALGDLKDSVVGNPGDVIGSGEDGAIGPIDFTNVWGSKVIYEVGRVIRLRDCNRVVDAVELVVDAEVAVED